MYLWNVNALMNDLKSEGITQREQFKYYLLTTIFRTALIYAVLYAPPDEGLSAGWAFLEVVATIVVIVFGLRACYTLNSEGDDKDFLSRVVCLNVPATIRVVVFFLVAMIALAIVSAMAGVNEEEFDKFAVMAGIITEIILWMYLASKIRKISAVG